MIVVGYVSTKEGEAALERAFEECKLRNEELTVIHSDRGGSGLSGEAARKNDSDLRRVGARLEDADVKGEVRGLVRGKEPAEDLIAVAEETDASLIIIGLRRRTPVGKLILGSNAQRVLLDAPCDVLAVKAALR
ncbi:universal stress protein [Janibacter cremeus]|uniref:Nucleotide-binding universal stress UspA family protein n=1 Tax=Janibacter cremeus TaxID=1285192 RepID=A0A852VNK8_9MICO|nr:universal stress protein [Janibacter cremeus]NYF97040.1 nucleotide-binding universal stress UspA family protein [Janibacter cremeus]